jgi:magnesium chelatase family protein
MLAKVFGSAVQGVKAFPVTIEVSVGQGKDMYIVGLPDAAVKESSHRVESAIKEARFQMPRQKVVVNLAPADIKKEGSSYDLPIALGVLAASGQILAPNLEQYIIMGELSLDGSIQPIRGA